MYQTLLGPLANPAINNATPNFPPTDAKKNYR